MISGAITVIGFLAFAGALAFLAGPRPTMAQRARNERRRALRRVYVLSRRERCRTRIIDKDHVTAIGDGPWPASRGAFPQRRAFGR